MRYQPVCQAVRRPTPDTYLEGRRSSSSSAAKHRQQSCGKKHDLRTLWQHVRRTAEPSAICTGESVGRGSARVQWVRCRLLPCACSTQRAHTCQPPSSSDGAEHLRACAPRCLVQALPRSTQSSKICTQKYQIPMTGKNVLRALQQPAPPNGRKKPTPPKGSSRARPTPALSTTLPQTAATQRQNGQRSRPRPTPTTADHPPLSSLTPPLQFQSAIHPPKQQPPDGSFRAERHPTTDSSRPPTKWSALAPRCRPDDSKPSAASTESSRRPAQRRVPPPHTQQPPATKASAEYPPIV